MPSITPSTDNSLANYYYNTLRKAQDDADQNTKKMRENHEKQLEDLDKSYKANLARKDTESLETIKNIQDSAENSLVKEREKFNSAIDQFKDETYNRHGIGGGYYQELENRYKKAANELQDQLDHERVRHYKDEENSLDRLREQNDINLRKQENESNKRIQSIQKETDESIERERLNSQTKIEGNKAISNDEIGSQKDLNKYYQKEIQNIADANEAERARRDLETQQRETKYRQAFLDKENEGAKSIRDIQENANHEAHLNKLQNQAEVDKIKNEAYHPARAIPGSISPQEYNDRIQNLQNMMNEQANRQDQAIDRLHEDTFQKLQKDKDHHENLIRNINQQHSDELGYYDSQLKSAHTYNKNLDSQTAKIREKLVSEQDAQLKNERNRVDNSYSNTIDKLQNTLERQNEAQAAQKSQALLEKDNHYTELLRKNTLDNYEKTKSLEDNYKQNINQIQQQSNQEITHQEEKLNKILERSAETHQKDLDSQAKSFQDNIKNNSIESENRIEVLQKALNSQKNPKSDFVSPEAEAAIRNPIIAEYEKKFNINLERQQNTTDSMQRKYIEQYKRTLEDHEEKALQIQQKHNLDQSLDRTRYLDAIQESEFQTTNRIRQQEIEHEKEKENLFRQFGNMIEKQKQDYDRILNDAISHYTSQLSEVRQELDLNTKSTQRSLNMKQNEIIRDYEKKLADQKTESDAEIENLKVQAQADLRNLERKSRQELEAQAKNYEQRLAQTEAQSKERERFMAQNYQDEIEKTKRSYELLNKKKS